MTRLSRLKNTLRFLGRRAVVSSLNASAAGFTSRRIQSVRSAVLRLVGCDVGDDLHISEHFYIYDGRRFAISDGGRLGAFCRIFDFSPIRIGKNFLASHNLTLVSGTHDVRTLDGLPGPITIGDNVWVGANVTMVGPVTVGDNVIIGACSLVIKDLPSNTICAGTPARVIRQRF
jgi:acetyltransferase-like isoleucine patch superfamily enzyme